jgi:3-methyladenine DNA glycosylase AlkD
VKRTAIIFDCKIFAQKVLREYEYQITKQCPAVLNLWKSALTYIECFQLSLTTGEEVEIEYEVGGWYYVGSHDSVDSTRVLIASENVLKFFKGKTF